MGFYTFEKESNYPLRNIIKTVIPFIPPVRNLDPQRTMLGTLPAHCHTFNTYTYSLPHDMAALLAPSRAYSYRPLYSVPHTKVTAHA